MQSKKTCCFGCLYHYIFPVLTHLYIHTNLPQVTDCFVIGLQLFAFNQCLLVVEVCHEGQMCDHTLMRRNYSCIVADFQTKLFSRRADQWGKEAYISHPVPISPLLTLLLKCFLTAKYTSYKKGGVGWWWGDR